MRVLHAVKTTDAAEWVLPIVGWQVELGWEVHLIAPPGRLSDRYRDLGVTQHDIAWPEPARPASVRWLSRIRQVVADVAPDLIHAHSVVSALGLRFALGRRHAVPRVFMIPGPLHLESPIFRRLDVRSAGPWDFWIATCDFTHELLLRAGAEPERVGRARYAIPMQQPTFPAPTRSDLGLPEGGPIIGFVAYVYAPKRLLGQSCGLKGHEDAIDAMALVRRKFPDATLAIVGGAWNGRWDYYERLQAHAEQVAPGSCAFLGHRGDVADLYGAFDVSVSPSLSENLGSPFEAAHFGVPIVATDVGGIPDLVIDGETGLLCPPKDPPSLANALIATLADPVTARVRAEAARARLDALMQPDKNAAAIRDVYDRMLAMGRPGM